MTTLDQLDRWLDAGDVSPTQHDLLSAIARGNRLSLFLELNVLLYVGVLAVVGGMAWTIDVYATTWGDAAILIPSTLACAGCFAYCFSRGPAYSTEQIVAPGLAFDYVLYLACLVFALELGYLEYRFHLLQDHWDYYLLASALLYFALAYRFDNRFVLSLGIATLGGWFGVRFTQWLRFFAQSIRIPALTYGALVAGAGIGLHRAGIKKHFLDTYLHVAANIVLAALTNGAMEHDGVTLWLVALLVSAAAIIAAGVRTRRFAFVVYGVVYGYIAVSAQVVRNLHSYTATLSYFVISALMVVAALVVLSRKFGRWE
jgi:hypothetical protein